MASERSVSLTSESGSQEGSSPVSSVESQGVLPKKLEQPWMKVVKEIERKKAEEGSAGDENGCEWFTSKEGYYYSHTT